MSVAGADRDEAVRAASDVPSGAARRARFVIQWRGESVVLPALVGAGVVLGLAVVHLGRDSGTKPVLQQRQRVAVAMPTVTNRASTMAAPGMMVDASDSAIALRAPPAQGERPTLPRRAESDADPADVPTPPSLFPTYDESAVNLAQEHKIPAEVSGAVDANARAAALRDVAASPSEDAFPLLERTLSSDSIARNRLLAVNSLRLLGKQAANNERAREALHLAMSDADENVRTSARDAYQELSR
jgi:hypothetical protein